MQFVVISLFPELVNQFAKTGLLHRASERCLIEIQALHLRDFAEAPHFRVDDRPFGGGPGMILMVEPIAKALASLGAQDGTRRLLMSTRGKSFAQTDAERLAKCERLILICGRYEGVDQRVADYYVDEEFRVGESVLMGGEIPAFSIIESVARLKPGVLGNEESIQQESFSEEWNREFPQYTRPRNFEGHEVPEVLVSGHHRALEKWKREQS